MTLYPEDIERYGQPTDEPTEADPGKAWAEHMRLSLAEVLGADEVEQWAAMDDPGAQRWHLLAASHEKLRALVGGRSAAPTRDEVDLRLADAQQHNETLKAERDEARAAVVEAREILDALIEWFGAPDWAGPDLPVELGRRIATLLGPRSAMDRVRAPWSPTPSLPAGVGIVRLSDCETFTLGERTHDDDTGQDGYEVNQGGFISDEAITSGRWALAVTDAVVALLSRPAEPPEAERILDEARSLMRTARSLDPTKPVSNELLGQVFGDLIDLLAPDGVAAEPNEEPTPWQESPMAAPRPEPFDDWRKDDRTL